jgi:gluconolactonase
MSSRLPAVVDVKEQDYENAEFTLFTRVNNVSSTRIATDLHLARLLPPQPGFISYDAGLKALLGDYPILTLMEERDHMFAHEAGVYINSTDCNYFTSNYQSGHSIQVHSINHSNGEIKECKYDNVVNANGACHYNDKILFCSQGDLTTPSALVLVDPATSESKMLLNSFHGREFNSINDVVVHHARDEIWFTDPTYGAIQDFRPSQDLPCQIYRFKPSTGQIWCVADGFVECNGLCFSPDYSKMYVTDTGSVQGPTPDRRKPASIYVFDVVDQGTRLANRRMFAYCDNGIPDGIKCDVHGNVYSGCGDGVHVWGPDGLLLGKIYIGSQVANFNFVKGGMWMMAEQKLFFCKMQAEGAFVALECK